jgi:uncharacterized membrane protein YphA (DoxX/SURF4 family)
MPWLSAGSAGYPQVMIGLRGLARTLIAGTFVAGGLAAWRRSATLAADAEGVTEPIARALDGAATSEQLVKANAAVQVTAGGLFAVGVAPRVMAIVLGASLVPTTLATHRFWEVEDPTERRAQQLRFLEKAAVLGGLAFAALDTGGRPSVFWSGRRFAADVGSSIGDTLSSTTSSVGDLLPEVGRP